MISLTEFMVLGHISGRTPGARKLAIWARANPQILLSTHDSFEEYFEVQFTQEDGRRRTLADLRYTLEGRDIIFYSWSPYFNADLPLNKAHLKTGFWAQIRELPPFLRTQEFLRETFEVFSEVLYIDDEDTYLTKLSGPRVRILTENVKTLPKTLLIPRLDGGSDIEYTLEYSGLKSQCSRCRSFEHTIQQCTIHRIPNTQRLNRQPSHNTNRGRAPSTSTSGIGKNQHTQSHKQATQVTTTTKFIWQPKNMKTVVQEPASTHILTGAHGYDTRTIHRNFWKVLTPERNTANKQTTSTIIPLFYRNRDGRIEALTHEVKAGKKFPLAQGLGEKEWQLHMVNQTKLNLRGHMVLKRKHINPIRCWEDVSWLYWWHQHSEVRDHCTFLALIQYNEEICIPRNPTGLQWQSFPANIQERLSRGLQQTSTLSETEGKTLGDFLGYNPEETPEESSNIGDCQNRESVTPEADKPND